jgi:hypothetical protein
MKHTPNLPFVTPGIVVDHAALPFAHFELCSNRILVVRLDDDVFFELRHAKEYVETIKRMGGGKPVRIMMIAGSHSSADHESRKFLALPEHAKYVSHSAPVTNSTAQRLVGNFFLKFNRPTTVTRLFTDPQAAWEWLETAGEKK